MKELNYITMKKFVLTFLGGFFVLSATAQGTFKVLQHDKTNPAVTTDVTGTTVVLEGSSDLNMLNGDEPMKIAFSILNSSGNPIKTIAKRQYQNNQIGTDNQFCWVSCYATTTSVSPDTIEIGANDTLKNTFYTHFWANGNEGDYTIRYIFFEADNESNENYIDITYRAKKTIGIKNEATASVKVYPNPVSDILSVEYTATEDGKFALFDITGKKITENILKSTSKLHQIDFSNLNSGVYFYTIVSNNKTIATKKLIKQ